MMMETAAGVPMSAEMFSGYMRSLINRFFKILPIREDGEATVDGETTVETYMRSLQAELLGFRELILIIHEDARFVTLLNILQYLIDNPECPIPVVKREVFRAITICNKLKAKYAEFALCDTVASEAVTAE